jgi:predicted double-glycine peptidase
LEKEIPIIADIKSFNYEGKNHWVVIEEIDLKNNKVRIADPNVKGNRRYISLEELDQRWKSKNMYTGEPLIRAGVVVFKN